jgi:hypothetical protein
VNDVEIASVVGLNNAEIFVIRVVSEKQSILAFRVESAGIEQIA